MNVFQHFDKIDDSTFDNDKVVVRYASVVIDCNTSPEPESTSVTDHIAIPGLYLISEFLSADEETKLLAQYGDSESWIASGINRNVQVIQCYSLIILPFHDLISIF